LKNLQFTLSAAVLVLGAHAFAQSASPSVPKEATNSYQILTAGKVLGLDVRGEPPGELGEIGDLLLDAKSGEIRYAVLEVGGFLGMGEDQRVVPWTYFSVVCDEKNPDKCHARTTLNEAKIKAAPKLKKDGKLDAELDKSIDAAFGKNDAWAFTGTGTPTFVRLTRAKGAQLHDSKGVELGKVEDVMLAPANSCVAYVVVDLKKDAGGKKIGLPWSKAEYTLNDKNETHVRTSIEASKLASAPEFDGKDDRRMASTPYLTELGTYYSSDPFWKTTRFANANRAKPEKP
jgi:sporulation protein YlmC with PRC-barrel domain